MKLNDFFSKKESNESEGLRDLLSQLDKYFEIRENHSFEKSTEGYLSADLTSRNGEKIPTMPVKMSFLNGTLFFDMAGLENLKNMPKYVTTLMVKQNTPLQLISDRELNTRNFILSGIPLTTLTNSANIRTSKLTITRCDTLTTLSGLETIQPYFEEERVDVKIDCYDLADSLNQYTNCNFQLTYLPHTLPLVQLISYYGRSEFPKITMYPNFKDVVSNLYSELPSDVWGGGARAVMPLIRFFRDMDHSHRIDAEYRK